MEYPPSAFADRPHYAEIASADEQLGVLLSHLEELGRRAETLVVFTSDHGESLGEHGELSHSYFAYQATVHVPLILSHASLSAGSEIASNVSLVDVMPTILELLGIEGPLLPPPGRSLGGLLRGQELPTVPVYFESLNAFLNYGWAPLQGVAMDRHKLIRVPRAELYDLSQDATEEHNIHGRDPELAQRMEQALLGLLEQNEGVGYSASAGREMSDDDRASQAKLGNAGAASTEEVVQTLADPKDGIERVCREERALALTFEGKFDEAIELVASFLRDDPGNGVFNSHYAVLAMQLKHYDEAVTHFDRSLGAGLRSVENFTNLGRCHYFLGDIDQALSAFQSALEVSPKNLLALFWCAQAHLLRQELELAAARLQRFLELWEGGEHEMADKAREQLRALGK